jgi:hypothetical protein
MNAAGSMGVMPKQTGNCGGGLRPPLIVGFAPEQLAYFRVARALSPRR